MSAEGGWMIPRLQWRHVILFIGLVSVVVGDDPVTGAPEQQFLCDMCVGMDLAMEDPLITAAVQAIGINLQNNTCSPDSYTNTDTMPCGMNFCGRGEISIDLSPPGGQPIRAKLTSRSCYEMFERDLIPPGSCTNYLDMPPDMQTAIEQDLGYFAMFGLASNLVQAEFCACDQHQCNGKQLDQLIKEGMVGNTGTTMTPGITHSTMIASFLCLTVILVYN